MTALRNYEMHTYNVSKSIFRISSGKKLPADDPAGMIIAQRLHGRIRELGVIIRKTEEMQDMLDCAYAEAMGRQNILQRMRELSLGMANDTLTKDDKAVLAVEFTELAKEFGVKTFEKTGMEIVSLGMGESDSDFVFKKGDMVYVDGEWKKISELEKELAANGSPVTVSTTGLTDYVDSIMKQNLFTATTFSAFASRRTFRLDRLYTEEENAIAALSRIEDIDIAKEMVEFVKESILAQTALAIGAQANVLPAHVLTLIETLPDTSIR
jgi:flagellin